MKLLSGYLRPMAVLMILVTALAITTRQTGQAAPGGPFVFVTNSGPAEALPVSVFNPPRQVVQVGGLLFCDNSTSCNGQAVTLYTVPPNKRLVVEYVSFLGQTDLNNSLSILFTVQGSDTAAFISIPLARFPVNSQPNLAQWVGSQFVRFYADAGATLVAAPYADNSDIVHPNGNVTISGYLVDTP